MLPAFRFLINIVARRPFPVDIRIIFPGPVNQGVIEPQLNALLAHLFGKRRQDIPSGRRGVDRAEIARLGIPKRESVVMLGGNDGVLRPTFLNQLRPISRVIVGGGEGIFLFHIVLQRNRLIMERPAFGGLALGINAPMDKNAQFGT